MIAYMLLALTSAESELKNKIQDKKEVGIFLFYVGMYLIFYKFAVDGSILLRQKHVAWTTLTLISCRTSLYVLVPYPRSTPPC